MSRVWNGNVANYLQPAENLNANYPTVAAWIKLASYAASSATTRPVAGHWNSGFNPFSELLFVNFQGHVGYEVSIPPISSVAGTTTVTLNTWHHVAGVYDGSIKVYLDGALDATLGVAGSPTVNPGGTWRIGFASAGPWVWDGEIAEVALWDRAFGGGLTANEIAALASGTSPSRITAGLLSHIPIWGEESPEPALRRGAAVSIVGTLPQTTATPLHPPVGSPFSAAG